MKLWPPMLFIVVCGSLGVAAGVAGVPRGLAGERTVDMDHARARLICETESCVAGKPLHLAVDFTIDEGWHLYWNGRNDTGFAPTIKLTLPDGFRALEPMWPTPKRYVVKEGNILDHIYEKRLTLIVPVEVPADLGDMTTVSIGADVEWLVCKEACLPGEAALTLKLPVGEVGSTPAKSKEAEEFKKARESLPREFKPGGVELMFAVVNDKLMVTTPVAQSILYYPTTKATPLADPIVDGEAKQSSMMLRFESGPVTGARISGIFEVVRRDKSRESYLVNATVEELVAGRR